MALLCLVVVKPSTGPMWELISTISMLAVHREPMIFLLMPMQATVHSSRDYQQAVEALEKKGIGSMMTGTNLQATFNYLNTEKELGIILEILKKGPSGVRAIPDGYYPR